MSSADEWGIQAEYLDSQDQPQTVSDESVARLRELVGRPPADLERTAPLVRRPGERIGERLHIRFEDGGELTAQGTLPPEVPLGYHTATTEDGIARRLIVSPGVCAGPDARQWGWVVQLYAARSSASWGIGDLADLRTIAQHAKRQGAGFVLINPLHAVAPTLPQQASPYFPSTRRFRNPIYLRVDGRYEGDEARIDRDEIWAAKRHVLRRQFDAAQADRSDVFLQWRQAQGESLQQFAVWSVLTERHGPNWREWPAQLRHPASEAVTRAARDSADDVSFHAWLQWRMAEQLRAATEGITVIQDLPIGVDPDGADAWTWQDILAQDVSVGAPPDPFNATGQDWGLPPFNPWKLRQAGYEPFIESIRATIAGAGGLRVDHVAGLFRLWWIPRGAGATQGGYVRYPYRDLLDIVALESVRAGAVVVGEDLGTVEEGVRETLGEHGLLTYRLLWFEKNAPPRWPRGALAAVTTHDLPTVAGLWSGADLRDQQRWGLDPDGSATNAVRDRLVELTDLDRDAAPQQAVEDAYRALAQAPCTLLAATLDDAVGAEIRPNIPGTTERDNWSIPLPEPLESVLDSPGAQRIAAILADAVTHDTVPEAVTDTGAVTDAARSAPRSAPPAG